jgi:hypothetical protein
MPLKTPPINPAKSKEGDNKAEEKKEILKNEIEEKELEVKEEMSLDKNDLKTDDSVVDSKEEFFRLMSEKIKESPDENLGEKEKNVSSRKKEEDVSSEKVAGVSYGGKVHQYKKMFYSFLFLAVILLVAVFYFSFVRLDITAYADRELVEDNLTFYAYSGETQVNLDRAVEASINRVELEISDIFTSTGEDYLGGEIVGRVTVINDYSRNQPLVATTRLLSSDDKLFRIKNTINVPAGGSVEVDIYSDESSEDLAISPDTFTIPGLWAGLQDQIYAESYEAFELRQDVKRYVSASDIETATNDLKERIINEAKSRAESNTSGRAIFSIDDGSINVEVSKSAGEEAESFEAKIKAIVNIIDLNEDDVVEIISRKLSLLDFDQKLSQIETESLEYELINFNSARSLAEIRVDFLAQTAGGDDVRVINKSHIVNLSERQIRAYLDGLDGLNDYDLSFRPGFIKRSSILSDRINIEYK